MSDSTLERFETIPPDSDDRKEAGPMVIVSAQVPVPIRERLDGLRERRGRPRQALIRDAITEYLEREAA